VTEGTLALGNVFEEVLVETLGGLEGRKDVGEEKVPSLTVLLVVVVDGLIEDLNEDFVREKGILNTPLHDVICEGLLSGWRTIGVVHEPGEEICLRLVILNSVHVCQ
jgi:hypothetical protein